MPLLSRSAGCSARGSYWLGLIVGGTSRSEVLNVADPLVIRPITAYDVPEPKE